MSLQKIKLISKKEVAFETIAFYFEKPEGFFFKAGQAIDLTLINPPETDEEGNLRTFSLASSPLETDLMIATRMRNTAFKRVLGSLPSGSSVFCDGPSGNLVLPENTDHPIVMIAGGIGITPFRSIILDATQRKLPHQITLFYANHNTKDAAFLEELTELQSKNTKFKLVSAMTKIEPWSTMWTGETGRIDPAMLSKYLGDLSAPVYLLAGPPLMVAGMRNILKEVGVADDQVKHEEFSGY